MPGRALRNIKADLSSRRDSTADATRQDWWPLATARIARDFNLAPSLAAVVAESAGYGGAHG